MMSRIVDVENISFSYDTSRTILEEVTTSIDAGDLITLLGPNGTGKSTLLNCISGILKPSSGRVVLDGRDIRKMTVREISRGIGYVPQNIQNNFDYTVYEYVLMGRVAHKRLLEYPNREDREVANEAIDTMGLGHLASRSFNRLSGGEQQHACIARALAQSPELIIMDEPTSALDFDNQVKVLKLAKNLSKMGYAVLMTTHNPEHALLLDSKTWMLNHDGKLSYGSSRELVNTETLSRLYSVDVRVSKLDCSCRSVCYVESLEGPLDKGLSDSYPGDSAPTDPPM